MFLLGGLLLSFTPCVLPMLPILSSIIVGQGAPVSRRRGFTLALAYSLGMALVYTAAGLLGSGFAAALQNPWVVGSFAALLAGLFGPPAVLLFDAHGADVAGTRTIGFEAADHFARRLDAAAL